MKLIKDALRVFYKSKIIVGVVVLTFIFSGIFVLKFYGRTGLGMVVAQLQQALKLSQYLFIVMMFISYEYIKKFRMGGIAEIGRTSHWGKKGKQFFASYFILSLWSISITIFISGCVIFSYAFYEIHDPNGEYIFHIIWNMLLNIFLIMELGALIGSFLSGFQKRIVSYVCMIMVAYLVSPYPERLADQVSISTNGKAPVYYLVELFNIMPLVNTNYTPNYSFGESLLPYRIALIFFWCALVASCILFSVNRLRKWTVFGILIGCVCVWIYSLPSSKVIMDGNPSNTLAHDQYYYLIQRGITKTEDAKFSISKYKMELSIGLQMDANVTMEVDKSLSEYKMTLYHGYKVKEAWSDENQQLEVKQNGDYVTIKNTTGKEIKQICLSYTGCSPAYYSNIQGIFLPGYFAYYPRAGYISLFDEATLDIKECFVDANTEFSVKINTKQKLYTNLEKNGDWYKGKCDGFTLLSGFYMEHNLSNGNRIVYPYLYGIATVDEEQSGEKAMDAYYDMIEKSLDDMGKKNTIVFCVPNVNQLVNQHNGQKQIITRSIAI